MVKTLNSAQGVSVLVLCKDNPDQLQDTLLSVLKGAQGLQKPLEVLVVDGSISDMCSDLCQHWIKLIIPGLFVTIASRVRASMPR